jgi:asparagine synthase (glutamine-hydrolysing)
MCGITGFIDFNNVSSKKDLESMSDTLAHRGPDASGIYFKSNNDFVIGLAHKRLSIIDINPCSNQPMAYKNFVITFNGEIYNYQEIKKELAKAGHSFLTHSDTEVILHAYEEYGIDCVKRFIGMFAFVIFDDVKQEVIFCVDRLGVKSVYYYWDNDVLLFASELKSFHQHPLFKKELNYNAVTEFLQYGYIRSSNRILRNVHKIRGGTSLVFSIKNKNLSTNTYWDCKSFYAKEKLNISFEEAKNSLKEIIADACNYRMVADVPVGVFLSGGYDSTLVTSILQQNATNKIKTFTIGVHHKELNEATYAKQIAAYLGTEHTELYCTENNMLDLIDDIPYYYDEPFGDSSAIPTMLVSKLAREKVTVALSADGGDETFAGYNRYDYLKRLKLLQTIGKIPIPSSLLENLFRNKFEYNRLAHLISHPTVLSLADSLDKLFTPNSLMKLFKYPETCRPASVTNETAYHQIQDNLSKFLAYDTENYLQNDILTKVDRATMSVGLEGREPLIDHRIIEFAATLPNNFKYQNGTKKYIIKEIVHDFVPKNMMERPKMGFGAPMYDWLKGALSDRIAYFLGKEYIAGQGIFDFKEIQKMKNNILQGNDRHFQKLWYVLVFQMWFQKWMNEK